MTIRSTFIARTFDGLPLAASMDDDELINEFPDYKQQSKAVIKSATLQGEPKCTIDSGTFLLHYLIEGNVCYLCICDKLYPKQLAFNYLEEIQKEFENSFQHEIESASRPYAFIKFDNVIQKVKKLYKDSRSQRNIGKLNEELNDVTRIMTKNIQDVLQRGEKMDRLSQLSSQLSVESKRYASSAKNLNLQALYRKYGPPVIVIGVVLIVLYFWSYF